MRSLILKSSSYVIILVVFNRLFWLWLPHGWENTNYYAKKRVFSDHYATETNTLFFGSSRTFAQIDPVLFDSLNAIHGLDTRSYTLASSSVFNNEMFMHLEELFENPHAAPSLRFLFVELSNSVLLSSINLFTPRQSYYITPRSIVAQLKQLEAQDRGLSVKLVNAVYYLASLAVNVTHLGYGNTKLQAILHTDTHSDSIWIRNRGHYALSTRNPWHRRGVYLDRYTTLMADTTVVEKAFQRIDSINNRLTTQRFNPVVYHKYLDLITRFEADDVHVVVMLPLARDIDSELMSLYRALPDDHKINLSSIASQIPELHHVDRWFDPGHINADGVVLFTTAFANAFSQRFGSGQRLRQ